MDKSNSEETFNNVFTLFFIIPLILFIGFFIADAMFKCNQRIIPVTIEKIDTLNTNMSFIERLDYSKYVISLQPSYLVYTNKGKFFLSLTGENSFKGDISNLTKGNEVIFYVRGLEFSWFESYQSIMDIKNIK